MASDAGEVILELAQGARRRWKDFVVVAAVGLVFLCMNVPKLLGQLLQRFVSQPELQRILAAPIQATQASLSHLRQPSPAAMLSRLMSWNFLLLLLFLALVGILALRHKDTRLPAFCMAGLAVGYFGGQFVAWVVFVAIKLFSWAALLVHWIGSALGWLFELLLHSRWIVVPLAVIVLLWVYRDQLRAMVAQWRAAAVNWLHVIGWILAAVAGVVVVWLVVSVVGPWLWAYLGPIFTFLGHLFAIIFHFVGRSSGGFWQPRWSF